uniref:Uncharacterized protein n=1 Tax=Peronospora matthiolae TaxID=2874970 RepID=A0AAV1U8B9_9STRA
MVKCSAVAVYSKYSSVIDHHPVSSVDSTRPIPSGATLLQLQSELEERSLSLDYLSSASRAERSTSRGLTQLESFLLALVVALCCTPIAR